IVGKFIDNVDFGDGGNSSFIYRGHVNAFVAKYGSDNALQWVNRTTPTNITYPGNSWAYGVAIDRRGYINATGTFTYDQNFNPRGTAFTLASGTLNTKMFLMQYDS